MLLQDFTFVLALRQVNRKSTANITCLVHPREDAGIYRLLKSNIIQIYVEMHVLKSSYV